MRQSQEGRALGLTTATQGEAADWRVDSSSILESPLSSRAIRASMQPTYRVHCQP